MCKTYAIIEVVLKQLISITEYRATYDRWFYDIIELTDSEYIADGCVLSY